MEDIIGNSQPELVGDDEDSEDEERPSNCCMRCMLSMQAGFKDEQSMLYKVSSFFLSELKVALSECLR